MSTDLEGVALRRAEPDAGLRVCHALLALLTALMRCSDLALLASEHLALDAQDGLWLDDLSLLGVLRLLLFLVSLHHSLQHFLVEMASCYP